jgi:Pvc16 N-terminal domain
MSAHLTIASVTAVLKNLLENTVVSRGVTSAVGGDITVTAVSPDRITAGGDEKPQLNLFLYQITPASMLRAPGLSLELYYLITAYGAQDYQAEILLGHAVQTMVEHQHLTGDTIQKTLAALGGGKSTRSGGQFARWERLLARGASAISGRGHPRKVVERPASQVPPERHVPHFRRATG